MKTTTEEAIEKMLIDAGTNKGVAAILTDRIMELIAKEKKAVEEALFQLLKKCTSSGDYIGASDDELKMIARFRREINALAHSQEEREEK